MDRTEYALALAELTARRSKDPSTKVGAVAIGSADRVLATGYNGIPRGVRDLPERMDRPAKYVFTAHAEENLVANAARTVLEGTTVTVTHLCCAPCARMLINAGVARVYVGAGKTSMDPSLFEAARVMFAEAGVQLDGPGVAAHIPVYDLAIPKERSGAGRPARKASLARRVLDAWGAGIWQSGLRRRG